MVSLLDRLVASRVATAGTEVIPRPRPKRLFKLPSIAASRVLFPPAGEPRRPIFEIRLSEVAGTSTACQSSP